MTCRAKLIVGLIAFSIAACAYADGAAFENHHCYAGQPQTLKHSDGNAANIAMIYGATRATSSGQIFDNMSTQCAALFGQMQGTIFLQGLCEWTDSGGDRIFLRLERQGTAGTFRSVSGTGKYQDVSVEGTYEVLAYPQRAGVLQGCARNNGRWERR